MTPSISTVAALFGALACAGCRGREQGAAPAPTGRQGAPVPGQIRYVLVLVKENHTFDNYFTDFPGARSSATAQLSTGETLLRPEAPTGLLPVDPCHTNACGQTAHRQGAMDGFDLLEAGLVPFIRYTERQIPNYWQYARNFVLADHFFSNVLGPSTPGHTVFWTGQALTLDNARCTRPAPEQCSGFGCTADPEVLATAFDPDTCATRTTAPCFDVPSLTDHLPEGFTWMNYGGRIAMMVQSVTEAPGYMAHFRGQADLIADLRSGQLANLTVAHIWAGEESEHPVVDPCAGENYTVEVINAAMQLPQWDEMAIVVTWDDWGGFYDHVPPRVRPCPDGQIFSDGFRVPALVISPYARQGLVLKTPTEQASVPRLVAELWGLPFMSDRDPHARDGAAGSLLGAFDFEQPPRPPLLLATRACP